jgi:hypothetical protein
VDFILDEQAMFSSLACLGSLIYSSAVEPGQELGGSRVTFPNLAEAYLHSPSPFSLGSTIIPPDESNPFWSPFLMKSII